MVVRVAILDDYQQVALTTADWSSIADQIQVDVFTDTLSDVDSLAKRLEPYEIICAMRERTKFLPLLLDRLPNLRLIATTGNGGNSTVEHIWTLIMSVARHIVLEHINIRTSNPQWQTVVPMGLAGSTLGLIGVGRLGSETAKIAKVFGMKVIGWSPHLTPERAEAQGVEFIASKQELLSRSDIVSLHLVLSESTTKIINAADLDLMKASSFLINTSRGPLIDEAALVEALKNKKIAGAGLDVFEQEPLPLDHPLRFLDNVTLSPHNGYINETSYKVFWTSTVENIKGYLDGKPRSLLE
ncbi:D-isomer specific 2-hydroxyacid dehydrogenase [Lentinula guzmanii]|uniref:D-isomer specific 2-hydroxyacid dehydrogenase n=1 Tax=Lentinula guzmanii TaxID=2804957 RepID=A0AA38JXQ5_9AGAR|nr:D-isomer specific 2-hydroxyacid dehydrogenase [Lentinula guzmanii]